MTGLPDAEPPATVVFPVATVRRVGAQLRYNGGVRLAEVRVVSGLRTCVTYQSRDVGDTSG